MAGQNQIICRGILVHIIRSARKSVSLEVKPDLTVNLRIPQRFLLRDARTFLEKHSQWLEDKYAMMAQRRQRRPETALPSRVELTKAERERIHAIFEAKAAYFAEKMKVTYGRISVRQQKTRWGSCSSLGNLNFNLKLLAVPEPLLDYVVVHELAHCIQMNHSAKFWLEVEKILPDYKERRRQLKNYCL